MKNSSYFIVLTIALIFLQIFLFNQVDLTISPEYAPYLLVYPLIYIILPMGINRYLLIGLAFFLGLFMDIFFDSPGVHAGASAAGAYFKGGILSLLLPQGNAEQNAAISLKKHNIYWLARYNGLVLLVHCIFLFSLEIFTFYFLDFILVKTLLTTILSLLMIIVIQLLYKI